MQATTPQQAPVRVGRFRLEPERESILGGRTLVDVCWSMVKDREVRQQHPHAYRWARAVLGLDDDPVEKHRPRARARRG